MRPEVLLRPWLIAVLCCAAVAVGACLTLAVPTADTTYLVLDASVGLSYPAVGALIVSRRRRNAVGLLFLLGGAGLSAQALAGGYAAYGQVHGWPGAEVAAWVVNWVFFTGFGPLLLLPLLLPDERPPSPRWRPVLLTLVAGMAVIQVLLMFRDRIWLWGAEVPSPIGFVPTDSVAGPVFAVWVAAAAIAGAAAMVVRVRAAEQRRLLLPVLASVVAISLAMVADQVLPPDPPIGAWLQAVTLPLFPAATAVAIFRYRLFDIEVLLRRTAVYAVVTGILLAAYLVTVTTVGTFLHSGGVFGPLAATAVVAVAFAPLRDAVQRAVGRLLFGSRGDPAAALSMLGQRLEMSADPTRLLDGAAETVAGALRLPAVAVLGVDGSPVCVKGSVPADGLRLPLAVGGRQEGELWVAPRSPGEALSAADLTVLGDLARQLAVALAAVRLAGEVQASRERLVVAREEERRRLRRDLHDGLGPGLVAIGVRLDLIEALVPSGAPPPLRTSVSEVGQLTRDLVADVRRVVHDLRPPALDELGLGGALEDLALDAEGGTAVTVLLPEPLPDLPAATEVAAYRIAQEALANALRHAGAERVEITARVTDGELVLRVGDDGHGLPPRFREGVGSVSMRERAAELGGRLHRTSAPGTGTIVEAVLPL
ncbi:hypothetical protein Misp01_03510 [Microtetraspora sp. NBRC 13810]|uniref:sensor histidine kinase n=1 Tax=Microtetraspora sp. NBRC 13810 TaxID=3030990 RepID=UPI0024A1F070|nr:sensor histidine kinase [Microtetraspora sp. NBRC 13810]GLW05221.1 hypothetical protein Misp01_03510 [Microtetraspora sp. NBRC 13810]